MAWGGSKIASYAENQIKLHLLIPVKSVILIGNGVTSSKVCPSHRKHSCTIAVQERILKWIVWFHTASFSNFEYGIKPISRLEYIYILNSSPFPTLFFTNITTSSTFLRAIYLRSGLPRLVPSDCWNKVVDRFKEY